MSIEGYNNTKRRTNINNTSNFMSAGEARMKLEKVIPTLVEQELTMIINKINSAVDQGKNSVAYAFTYGCPKDVIAETIVMLSTLGYFATISNIYHDVIRITW